MPPAFAAAAGCGPAERTFLMNTTLDRATRELALRKRMQEALLMFSRGVSARLALESGLEDLSREINELFGADRTSVWLHDRRSHSLKLAGSSDSRHDASQEKISTADDSPVARGLRQDGAQVTGSGAARMLVAPLRGWRRALGTLVIDGQARHIDDQLLVELTTDFARQLSIAIEGVVVLEELIRQQVRLLQTEKLASLGQFIAGIAHEMNNPLQSVLGHLELMIRSKDHAPHRAELKRIYHDADRAAKVVNDLLVFGGSRRVVRKAVDVGALIGHVIAIREAALTKSNIEIVKEVDGGLPDASGDAELLQQALLNVVLNAEQAIAEARHSGRVTINASAQDGRVLINVDDNGPGISAEVLPKIFDPFFTT
jgi:signal transduction histidine kinase